MYLIFIITLQLILYHKNVGKRSDDQSFHLLYAFRKRVLLEENKANKTGML